MDFAGSGKTRRCTTGIPSPQQLANNPTKSTKGRLRSTAPRRPSAEIPTTGPLSGDARSTRRPTVMQKEVSIDCCSPPFTRRCLKRASSFHTNSTLSPSKDLGDSPRFRARANLSSTRAERETVAASLHQAGQAALMAGSLKPACLSLRRRALASLSISNGRYVTNRLRQKKSRLIKMIVDRGTFTQPRC